MARRRKGPDTPELKPAASEDECTIPPPMPPEAMGPFVLGQSEMEERRIREYVEWQASDETVTHAEKVKSEPAFGRRYDAWDVYTDKGRWWVITTPTNLYSQALFPSLDYTLSFHIGLMARVEAHQPPTAGP